MTFVTMIEQCLTLSWESPAAGGLFSQFGSFWKRQSERNVESLACGHCHWWHLFPGSWFRQHGGLGRTRRLWGYRVCAVHGDGELERRDIWRFGLKGEQGERSWHWMSSLCNLPSKLFYYKSFQDRLMTHKWMNCKVLSQGWKWAHTHAHTLLLPQRQSWRPGPAFWLGGCWYRPRREACRCRQRRFLRVHWSRICWTQGPEYLQPPLSLLMCYTALSLDPLPWSEHNHAGI